MSPSGQLADAAQVRCACETMATTGMIIVAGEIRTQAYVDVPAIAREVLREIGYDRAKYGFDCDTCGVLNAIHDQSPDIAQGVGVLRGPARPGRRRPLREGRRRRPGHDVQLRLRRDVRAHAHAHLPGTTHGRPCAQRAKSREHQPAARHKRAPECSTAMSVTAGSSALPNATIPFNSRVM